MKKLVSMESSSNIQISSKVLLLLILFCMQQLTLQQPMENFWWEKLEGLELNYEKYDEQLKTDKIVVIDIYSRGCYYCFRMMPTWNELVKDMAEFEDKIILAKLDGPENSRILQQHMIEAFPTQLLLRTTDQRKYGLRFGGHHDKDYMKGWMLSFVEDQEKILGNQQNKIDLENANPDETKNDSSTNQESVTDSDKKITQHSEEEIREKVINDLTRKVGINVLKMVQSKSDPNLNLNLNLDELNKEKELQFIESEEQTIKNVLEDVVNTVVLPSSKQTFGNVQNTESTKEILESNKELIESDREIIARQNENWDYRFDKFEMKLDNMFQKLLNETDSIETLVEHQSKEIHEIEKLEKNHDKSNKILSESGHYQQRLGELLVAVIIGGVLAAVYIRLNFLDKIL